MATSRDSSILRSSRRRRRAICEFYVQRHHRVVVVNGAFAPRVALVGGARAAGRTARQAVRAITARGVVRIWYRDCVCVCV